jgi:hypothetical protein
LILLFSAVFSFVQTDVIEVHYAALLRVVESTDDDIQLVSDSHDKFVKSVLTESLI